MEQRITSDKMQAWVEGQAQASSPEDLLIAIEETTHMQVQGMDEETFELLVDIPASAIIGWR